MDIRLQSSVDVFNAGYDKIFLKTEYLKQYLL